MDGNIFLNRHQGVNGEEKEENAELIKELSVDEIYDKLIEFGFNISRKRVKKIIDDQAGGKHDIPTILEEVQALQAAGENLNDGEDDEPPRRRNINHNNNLNTVVEENKRDFEDISIDMSDSYKRKSYQYIHNAFPHYHSFILIKALMDNRYHLIPTWKALFNLQNEMEEEDINNIENNVEITNEKCDDFSLDSPKIPNKLDVSVLRASILPIPMRQQPFLGFAESASSSSSHGPSSLGDDPDFVEEVKALLDIEGSELSKQFHKERVFAQKMRINNEGKTQERINFFLPNCNFPSNSSSSLSSSSSSSSYNPYITKEEADEILCDYKLDCPICGEEKQSFDCIECQKGHAICYDCLEYYVHDSLGKPSSQLKCQTEGCNSYYADVDVRRALFGSDDYKKWSDNTFKMQVQNAGIECIRCFNCDYLEAIEKGMQKPSVFRCKNIKCGKLTCTFCNQEAHKKGKKCPKLVEEDNEISLRNYIQQAVDECWIRYCPKCNAPIIKDVGCNHMRCTCEYNFCLICKQPMEVQDNPSEHFDKSPSCKQFTEPKEDHERESREAREAALKADAEWRAKHPNYKGNKVDPLEIAKNSVDGRYKNINLNK